MSEIFHVRTIIKPIPEVVEAMGYEILCRPEIEPRINYVVMSAPSIWSRPLLAFSYIRG